MYYPPSEITPNQYTTGYDLVYKSNGKSYSGYYYYTTDGRFFTGKNYTPGAEELLKFSGNSKKNLITNVPTEYIPVPTEQDYEKGYIKRFVTKRVNSGEESIVEVNESDYIKTIPNPLYTQAYFLWYISGPLLDHTTEAGYKIPGVISKNEKSLMDIESKVPGVSKYFINLVQYHK